MSSPKTRIEIQAHGRLRRALLRMAERYPYNASLFSLDRFEASPKVGTMAVMYRDERIRFAYAPRFVANCHPDKLMGVLHHEVNHVLFGHIFADPKSYSNRRARTIAEEVTVNEWVNEPLPGKPITLADFPFLPPGEDTDTRYRRLLGHPLPPEAQPLDRHDLWQTDEPDQSLGAQRVLRILKGVSFPRTSEMLERIWRPDPDDPGTVEELKQDHQPDAMRVPWQRLLQRCRPSSSRRQATFQTPPRRFPHLVGAIPAIAPRRTRPRVMAIIDTSGSMKQSSLARINRELGSIRRLAEVTVVQCDKKIRASYPLRGPLREIRGRGGTDFRPPLEREFLRVHRPDVVIYFTDGDGPAPERPPRVGVIWCLIGRKRKRPASWGEVVTLA